MAFRVREPANAEAEAVERREDQRAPPRPRRSGGGRGEARELPQRREAVGGGIGPEQVDVVRAVAVARAGDDASVRGPRGRAELVAVLRECTYRAAFELVQV